MLGREDRLLDISHRAAQQLAAQRDRPAHVVIFETLRDAFRKPGRRANAGRQDILCLYYSEWVASRARPVVHAVRQETFGKTDAPFHKWADAKTWVLVQADLTMARTMEVMEKARDAYKTLGLPDDAIQPLSLCYASPGKPDDAGIVYFTTRSKLATLLRGMEIVTEITGWSAEAALAHVLVGAHVVTGQASVIKLSMSLPQSGGARYMDLRLWPWEIPHEMRDRLPKNRLIRAVLQHPGPNPIHPLDAQLLLLMELEGYPQPSKGKGIRTGQGDFWNDLSAAWNRVYRRHVQRDALRKRWERMSKELQSSLRDVGKQPMDTQRAAGGPTGTRVLGGTQAPGLASRMRTDNGRPRRHERR